MSSISGKTDPVVRPITAADVIDALGKGLRDFQAMPLYGLALGALSEEDAFHDNDEPEPCRDASMLAARFRALGFMLAALLTLAGPAAPHRAACPLAGGGEPVRRACRRPTGPAPDTS